MEPIETKDILRGTRLMLRNGWEAETLEKTLGRGITPMCKVFGFMTECGSVYLHDIRGVLDDRGNIHPIKLSPAQAKRCALVKRAGF